LPGRPPRSRVSLETTDRTAARQELARLVKEGTLGRVGLAGREVDEARRPLSEHLADFRTAVQAGGATAKQANQVHNRAKALCDGLPVQTGGRPGGVEGTGVGRRAARQAEEGGRLLGPHRQLLLRRGQAVPVEDGRRRPPEGEPL